MDRPVKDRPLPLRALGGHSALGLIAAGLLYLVCLSGALAVFAENLQRWEDRDAPEMSQIDPAAVQTAIENILALEGDKVDHVYVHMPTDALPRTVVTAAWGLEKSAFYVDGDGTIAAAESHRWTEFVLELHYYLHLPETWGMILTGTLGAMLAALGVTGVLAHPRIVRDAFRLKARSGGRIALTDWHNRLGTWTLPFAVMIAITGAAMGLGAMLYPAIAESRYDGDLERAYAPVFGSEPADDPSPAPVPRADQALRWMAANHPEKATTYVVLEHPRTAGQQVSIIADHDQRLIYGETYLFDGRGSLIGTVGLSDGPTGQQALASIYKLHFGNFAGLPVQLAYFAFGLVLSGITATGVSIWLAKRRQRGQALPRAEAAWAAVVWGAPSALALAAIARIVAGQELLFVVLFWAGMAAAVALGVLRPHTVTTRSMRALTGAALTAVGALHLGLSGQWSANTLAIDFACLATGLALIASVRWRPKEQSSMVRQPAAT